MLLNRRIRPQRAQRLIAVVLVDVVAPLQVRALRAGVGDLEHRAAAEFALHA